jgi:uncharacterized protein
MNRRAFLFGVAGVAMVPGYAFGLEPHWFDVTTKTVALNHWKSGLRLRLLHLADFHASDVVPWSMLEKAIHLGLKTKPDLICLTGDFVTGRSADLNVYSKVLEPLARAAPTFASFGNHDGGVWVSQHRGYENTEAVNEMLVRAGITTLKNIAKQITLAGQRIDILGFGDLYAEELRPARAFAQLNYTSDKTPRILLSHNPDSKAAFPSWEWDLLLCGHTHGGQVKIPFYGAPLLPIRDRRFAEGLVPWKGRYVHVTRGVGNLGGFRVNCPPEISVLELVAASSAAS